MLDSSFIKFIKIDSKPIRYKVITSAILSGVAGWLVTYILTEASQDYPNNTLPYFLSFFLSIFTVYITRAYALKQTGKNVINKLNQTSNRLIDKIGKSDFAEYEKIEQEKVLVILSKSSSIIIEGARHFTNLISAGFMLLFSFLYLGYLSQTALLVAIVLIIIGVALYSYNQVELNDVLHDEINTNYKFVDLLEKLTKGFKECKINSKKREHVYKDLFDTLDGMQSKRLSAYHSETDNMVFAQMFFYVLIGTMIFIVPVFEKTKVEVIVALVPLLLFILGPLGSVVEDVPMIMRANLDLEKVLAFEEHLDSIQDKSEDTQNKIKLKNDFQTIHLKDILFSYKDKHSEKTFSIGELNLDISRGEIVFITGGNGSGKTTLSKVLTGLYYPHKGYISINDEIISIDKYQDYRNMFSTIFTDFYLFKKIYGVDNLEDSNIDKLLIEYGLADKTNFINGEFTNIDLSTGQKKRLALINALLEDKKIMLLDELAADQDPEFREYFYNQILNELKSLNKILIVISHDDRYFYRADKLIQMEYGKIVNIRENNVKE